MAAYRSGALGGLPSINECSTSPTVWEQMGCGKPPQLVGADGREWPTDVTTIKCGKDSIAFYRHPELFITPSVQNWLKEYEYYNGNHSIVPYHERHSAWVECLNIYERYLGAFKSG